MSDRGLQYPYGGWAVAELGFLFVMRGGGKKSLTTSHYFSGKISAKHGIKNLSTQL